MTLLQRILAGSLSKLIRAACIFALLGLALMAYSIVDPRAVPVIAAMSIGHAFGISAFACYVLAVVLEARRSSPSIIDTPSSSGHSASESTAEVDPDFESKPKQDHTHQKSSTE